MPLLDRQARGAEIGRIRLGTSRPGKKGRIAVRLETLRFTSRSLPAIERIAALYGGQAREWSTDNGAPTRGQFEVITKVNEVAVAVPPGEQILTQDYEGWDKGVRRRLCDGVTERLGDPRPCVCSVEGRRSCKPTSRLKVILPDVPGGGTWTLATHGNNAADELAGTAALMQLHAAKGGVLPAVLRMEYRRTMTEDEVLDYPVPVLMLTQSFRELTERAVGMIELPESPPQMAAIEAARTQPDGETVPEPVEMPIPPATPPGGFERPRDATHLAQMVEESPAEQAWIDDMRSRAERAEWLDDWVDTRYSDAMARLREVFDWRTDEIKEAASRG